MLKGKVCCTLKQKLTISIGYIKVIILHNAQCSEFSGTEKLSYLVYLSYGNQ